MTTRDERLAALGPEPDPSTATSHAEVERLNAEWEEWADAREAIYAADYEANPEAYTTYQDKSGRFYTMNADGSRKYREMRTCDWPGCGERNEVEHKSWWEEHRAAHEHKAAFDRDRDPLIRQVRKYASEKHYGPLHVQRWKRVLTALGDDSGMAAMSLAEAEQMYRRFSRRRWGPVVKRMRSSK